LRPSSARRERFFAVENVQQPQVSVADFPALADVTRAHPDYGIGEPAGAVDDMVA